MTVVREIERRESVPPPATVPPVAPPSSVPESATPGRRSPRLWLKRLVSLAVGLALLAFSLKVLAGWAEHVTLAQLWAELVAIGPTRVVLAVVFTGLSFVALVGYEYYAVGYTRRQLALPVVALYSFITQGIAHATGFAIFIGATVRYKLYGARGFSLLDVITIQVYFSTTFGLALFMLVGLGLALDPEPLAHALGTGTWPWRFAGSLLILAVAAVVFTSSVLHRKIRLFGHLIDLPSLGTSLFLLSLGVGDLLGVAATLHVLLPEALGLSYFETLAIFVAALGLGLLSSMPGSLGVFEGAVMLLVDPAPELAAAVLGALVAFRAIYYMLPLLLALLSFGLVELVRLVRRPALARPDDARPGL